MKRRNGCRITFAVLAALVGSVVLAVFVWLPRPISDPVKLEAIRAEARSLRVAYPVKPPEHYVHLSKDQLPPAIAGLHPEFVTVHSWGVDVPVKLFFDGGWGYHIARDRRDLPMPAGCYSEVSTGVFWHGPC